MEVIVNNSILAYLRPEHVEYLAIGTRVIVERVEEDYAYLIRNGQSPYMYKSHLRPTGDCLVKFNNEWISPVERVRRECLASGLIEYKNFWVTSNTQHRWRSKAEYQEWLLKLEVDRQYINNSAPYYIPCPPDKRTYIYTVAQPRNLNEE